MPGYYEEFNELGVKEGRTNPVGYGINLSPMFVGKNLKITTDKDRLEQAMREILDTNVGSRFMLPQWGSKLYSLIGEPNDFILAELAAEYTKDALEKWEPRINLVDITAEVKNNEVIINIYYENRLTGMVGNFTYVLSRDIPEMR